MKKYSFTFFSTLLISALMVFSPVIYADMTQELNQREQELNQREQELNQREQALNAATASYGDRVGDQALRGATNIATSFLEFPKSMINITNESNIVYGLVGGAAKGILNTAGRAISGFADLITAPILTKPVLQPNRISDDFDTETTYGSFFRVDNEPQYENK